MHRGLRIKLKDVTPEGQQVILGPDEATGDIRPGRRRMDRAVFAEVYLGAKLTAPGDVLVTTKFPLRGARVAADMLGSRPGHG